MFRTRERVVSARAVRAGGASVLCAQARHFLLPTARVRNQRISRNFDDFAYCRCNTSAQDSIITNLHERLDNGISCDLVSEFA